MKFAQAAVIGSFAGDSLALGAHWIYDTAKIKKKYGRVSKFIKPKKDSYHSTKKSGEFTHYGDQQLILLKSLIKNKNFNEIEFKKQWSKLFQNKNGDIDKEAKAIIENRNSRHANDFTAVSRISPLVYLYQNNENKLIDSVITQTKLTHSSTLSIETALFFAKLTYKVLHNQTPREAIENMYIESNNKTIKNLIKKGIKSKNEDTLKTIINFGQSSQTISAFPSVIHIIDKYEKNPREALIQSTISGGDNAARNMVIGMVLGAHNGLTKIPEEWINNIKKISEITGLLKAIS